MSVDGDELSLFDRSTLVFWRVTNLVGWPVVGMVAGLLVGFLMINAAILIEDHARGFGDISILWLTAPVTMLAMAGVGGWIVGGHVYRFAVPIAGVLGVVHGVWSGVALWYSPGGGMTMGVTGIVAACLAARIARRRRPIAFRGGRGVTG